MAQRKIPPDAFDYYFSLGPNRSYEAVAAKYGVSKRAITKAAARENWQGRLSQIEAEARERADRKYAEAREAMNNRHIQSAIFLQQKALKELRETPLSKAAAAVKALDVAVRQERLVRGEPSERTEVAVEDVIKREYARWMVVGNDEAVGSEVGSGDTE